MRHPTASLLFALLLGCRVGAISVDDDGATTADSGAETGAGDSGSDTGGADSGGADSGGADSGGADSGGGSGGSTNDPPTCGALDGHLAVGETLVLPTGARTPILADEAAVLAVDIGGVVHRFDLLAERSEVVSGAQTDCGLAEGAVSAAGDVIVMTCDGTPMVSTAPDWSPRVLVSTSGIALGASPSVSADGRMATLNRGGSGAPQIVRIDLVTGALVEISVRADGEDFGVPALCVGYCGSYSLSVSADGRRVVFDSNADGLTAEHDNDEFDVYAADLESGELRVLSQLPGNVPSNGASGAPEPSGDGNWVVFRSFADDLTDGYDGFFVVPWEGGALERVSVGPSGGALPISVWSDAPNLDHHGTLVAFEAEVDGALQGFVRCLRRVGRHSLSIE